jgi:7,8-dihydropterin-6-yl-methyl-4-(beta-D-ribofuranosyl)aminobenzene 5'-phosphate synthase
MSATNLGNFKPVEADGLEILSLVDNSVDFLSTTNRKEVQSFRLWTKGRHGKEWAGTHAKLPFAEHGFSMLIRILQGGKSHCILFDTGCSSDGVVENAGRMGIDLREVECIVLSHGHYDHFGGLLSALKAINKVNLPVIVHEDMFKARGTASHSGEIREYPEFPLKELVNSAQLIETKQPFLLAEDMLLVTGEIPRETSFEKGYLQHKILVKGAWQADPWIWDDRAIAVNVKEKGLVVILGCAHAGVINTLAYAQRITGGINVHAVFGGFHLAGKDGEKRIGQTVKALKRINPTLVAPSHCTGWRAMCTVAAALPDAFVWNSVGNFYQF